MNWIDHYFKNSISNRLPLKFFLVTSIVVAIICTNNNLMPAFSQELPLLEDPSLKLDLVADGLQSPTSMAFLTDNSILITHKEGTISKLELDNPTSLQPILELNNVNSKNERGLLGIAIGKDIIGDSKNNTNQSEEFDVFVFVTATGTQSDEQMQETSTSASSSNELRNKVYKYTWDGESLSNPTILLDLPAGPGTNHQGGKVKIGPDNQLYAIVGELQREGQLQNIHDGPTPDDSGVIFRVDPSDGSPSVNNPFVQVGENTDSNLLSKYYAYGIRNSFGMDFDPVTGKLWNAENGQDLYDEINLVEPGFNSGWKLVMGPISGSPTVTEDDLVTFHGSNYADPLLSWEQSRGVTDLEFLKSGNLGQKYQNNIFVGDITRGNLFFFEVNENRNGLQFDNNPDIADDLVVSTEDEISSITLGSGFKGITDIETGPDGDLYILTYSRADGGQGALYRISSSVETTPAS
ncbi:PQQ-dependent sugar dehydrogenase [Candidatus Nitrosocosmicus sp. FF01]|jgi:glucose/arabinose dehydrogenase|uniref:PQQ-dependent sugar dehydrogenase n=1 Tax=Candidatus Nitrosocosmicus sp. FF01 TaxID=3397670 RepID=UPI0039EB71B5